MNILMVGPDPKEKGGIATVISNFKQYYTSEKHQLFFLSSWSEKSKWKTEWQAFRLIRKVIHNQKIDVVHFHVAQKGSFYRKALLSRLVPKHCRVIFHMHASQFDLFYEKSRWIMKALIRHVFNRIDHVVVLGENWKKFYQTVTTTEVSIIQNAVQIPESSSYDAKSKTIVTFGRIGKRKGSYDLLQVAARMDKDFPEVKFVLYGDGDIEGVSDEIKMMGLQNVELGGWVSKEEQAEILKTTMLHFLPSYREGLPMAVLETMASGIPNLTTNVGDIPAVISDGKNGMLVCPGEVEVMANELACFIKDDNGIQNRYSKNARQTIEQNFSFEAYMRSWEQIYKKT